MGALKPLVHNHDGKADHSLVKTITFAITHFVVAFSVAFVLTGDLLIGSLIAMVEPAINTVAYFFHEKLWTRIQDAKSQEKRTAQASAPQAFTC